LRSRAGEREGEEKAACRSDRVSATGSGEKKEKEKRASSLPTGLKTRGEGRKGKADTSIFIPGSA